jgi:beta-galactosidase
VVAQVLRTSFLCLVAAWSLGASGAEPTVGLPEEVKAVWSASKAYRETTPTRGRICLNGLWKWQPADTQAQQVPTGGWGWFKVPGSWPGITDYMQKDSQTVFAHPDWKNQPLKSINAAWYQREFTVPRDWAGRRIVISAEYLNSYAAVFVDKNKVGEIRFPAGELDITSACTPDKVHVLSMQVIAMPMKAVALAYKDSAAAREVKGSVARRGLCGDVYLVGEPPGPRIGFTKVDTSVRKQELTLGAAVSNLDGDGRYLLRARVMDGGRTAREFTSPTFQAGDLKEGRIEFTEKWMPENLWDIHTPKNTLGMELSLHDDAGRVLDVAWPVRFGFREFWIEGRDFLLNDKRIHLSAVPLDNAQVGAALATYQAARESLERLKSFGINFVYTHNYDCEPGSHLSFAEILRAADDVGMLVGLTQPHFSGYDWQGAYADEKNGYARDAAFYAGVALGHPSVVLYSMSHNATGYDEDMNPDMIDGVREQRDTWASKNAGLATRAEAIVKRLDPGRVVYHHASGNLGSMHAINFYPNMVPIQELSDWFEHWATDGVKPAFMCEYGAPFTWDWTMYRGWYKGEREFGSAKVPWEFCVAEWNAQLFGDRAYATSEPEKANLRWEAKQFRAGNLWHRWDYPNEVGSARFEERYPLFAMYLTDNWRAFRTWGLSAISPWEFGHFWKLRDGVKKQRESLNVDWEKLQRPGFSPDYRDQVFERMDMAYERSDWIATPAAQALLRNNRPLLAYLGGRKEAFTSKDHNFFPGETVEKQIIVINDSRDPVTCKSKWSFGVHAGAAGAKTIIASAGGRVPALLRFELPATVAPGRHELSAQFAFDGGETQTDSFSIDVLPRPAPQKMDARIAMFDPKGETRALFDKMGVQSVAVEASSDLSPYDILIVGKAALTAGGQAPDVTRVREGLKVVLFEQTSEVLEKRFGFRVAEYGLRQVFPRVPDHPVLSGLGAEHLRDWRGSATILPPRLAYESRPRHGPTVQWCGMPVSRLWRCGNRGNVASVLIEKPACGDFLSILDGGYSLQYSTLLEYREGKGMVVFCQTDVTGRSEDDPAGEVLLRNLLAHVANWKPGSSRKAVYAGDIAGKNHLKAVGVSVRDYDGGKLSPDEVLVAGLSGSGIPAGWTDNVADWLKAGGNLLAIGLDQAGADALLPSRVRMKQSEHIAAFFEPPGFNTLLAGIGPANVHNRDPRELPLVATGAQVLGNGILAKVENSNVVFCQLTPWQFDSHGPSNLRRTRRHASILVSRLLANMGVASSTPLLERFQLPAGGNESKPERRWTTGFYVDQPEEWDDPYRFFRW